VYLTTVSAQAPKEDFQFPMTLYTAGAKLDFWAALQVTIVDTGVGLALLLTLLFTNGETPSKSPKVSNYCPFLAIVNSIHSLGVVYVRVQALSGWIPCCICWGSPSTPEEM
jgi:hypothetical protein